ncbi:MULTISPECIES: hypothetical protein [Pelosinus]|nr:MULTISPECIES: hypothetical protein [Pelosinus]
MRYKAVLFDLDGTILDVRWTRVSWETILHETPDFTFENMDKLLMICGV